MISLITVKFVYFNIDYKNIYLLRKYITTQGKILPRNLTKLTAKEHRLVVKSVKQSRILGLLPFINKEN
uniref:Small ribosomal subunit protein bS18c n=1 Tax=Discoplastis spathirhyncha TaxID=215771 RepID=A0A3G3LLA8_9EUGL|nr:ribosomal protein S18 [Discoplastis spathirhyncha]AYQ93504.1 ribosomal protein S18 [Discoplastis spathirhyncha]